MGIAANLQTVHAAIAEAAQKAGRSPSAVQLIAVSKTHPAAAVLEAMQAGQIDFGENKVQEMVEKHAAAPSARWHMIGTLQRNKVRQIAPFVHLIHSIDSAKLLEEVDRQAQKNKRIIDCLLQINISDEAQKSGMEEEHAEAILKNIAQFPAVRIVGLMGMAALTDDQALIAAQFHRLSNAMIRLKYLEGDQVLLRELSMGMSGDFDIAIACGATMVRIGSSIFGHRSYSVTLPPNA
jgi:pyridoxal phosphate enzyme (YggS family)